MKYIHIGIRWIMSPIERVLDSITMYRVVLYGLTALVVAGLALTSLGIIQISPLALFLSLVSIISVAVATHYVCAYVTGAPANIESTFITAFILTLILNPSYAPADIGVNMAITILAIAGKYILVYKHRHIVNPAVLALVIGGVSGYASVAWWVGSRYMLPLVLIVGLAVAIKTRRLALVALYVASSSAVVTALYFGSYPVLEVLSEHFLSTPVLFFATIMLTEPLTMPPTRNLQYAYVLMVSVLASIPLSFGPFHTTPELALLIGNVWMFAAVLPKRLTLSFLKRVEVGKNTFEYYFKTPSPANHTPGQYFEWTLPHSNPDLRGIRRYFTISSAPHSDEVSFTIKHLEPKDTQSSWKRTIQEIQPNGTVYAAQLAGDFTLGYPTPRAVWIAGGIGVTPFMSMIRAATQKSEKLDVTLLYCNRTEGDIAFKEEVARAEMIGVRTVHFLGEAPTQPLVFEKGFVTQDAIKKHVPLWSDSKFFISGPPSLVASYETMLVDMGVSTGNIVVDYFPGLA